LIVGIEVMLLLEKMNKIYSILFLWLFSWNPSFCQWDNLVYDDSIYSENIHSVQFSITGLPLTQPILDLDSRASLELRFDDLGEELQTYYYTFLHCKSDWTPSDLNVLEFLDGFDEEEIRDPDFSFNTLTEYTHYQLRVPNRDMKWTKSGNYILVVYDEEKNLVLTRRFLAVEPLVRIDPQMTRPASMKKFKTHQELDFKVSFEKLNVKDPKTEIKATIMQNGRWDSAIENMPPYFLYDREVVFDYQDKISFPAGKEFRFIDAEGVAAIDEFTDGYEVTLHIDPIRKYEAYSFIRDINGAYTIENLHRNIDELESDYAMTLFSLEKSVAYRDAEVYLFGKITDWKIQEKFKMKYNERIGGYLLDTQIKQGFYNYAFAVVSNKDKSISLEHTEGNWHETENDYTILIYYKPFGERYDRLVGAYTFNSYLRD